MNKKRDCKEDTTVGSPYIPPTKSAEPDFDKQIQKEIDEHCRIDNLESI